MRTKHLFYTAAMAALFAACVNDDFETISEGQNAANDGRPVVSDVKLVFGDPEAETRLVFDPNRGYGWEANDTIGALLMDNVKDHEGTWLEKYELIADIHTSYPFTYNRTDRSWGCNTKMLEGNYFFAYPWEDYDGKRRVAHSLTNQQQNGVTEAQKYVSYAENQFFIGYAQIKAGTSDKDVLNGNTVTMVPVLGAIQLQISNTGTKPYHINKVVLKGEDLSSTMTFNPTDAAYGPEQGNPNKWNLGEYGNVFNYANYTGNETDVAITGGYDYVYTIDENDEYERNEALRRVVKAEGQDEFAQIIINGTEQERLLKPQNGNTAYVLIMANADENVSELLMDIYTDEGMVQNVDLTVVNEAGSNGAPLYQVITSTTVEEIGPSVSNTIRVQIDDNSFVTPNTMNVYNTADLAQFIQWNAQETGRRNVTARLVKPDIELTKEMVEILTRKDNNVKLTIVDEDETGTKTNEVLTLAKDVPANILNLGENLTLDCGIKVLGTVNVDKNSQLPTMEIAEDAVLNINEDNENRINVTNKGTMNIAQKVEVSWGSITNENELNIAAEADINATVYNQPTGVIAANGYLSSVYNYKNYNDEEEYGVINMGKGAIIANGYNYGEIRTAEDAQVSLTDNNGEVIYVDGATVSVPEGTTVAYECEAESIDKTLYETLTDNGVNKLTLTKGITTIKVADVEFDEIATEGGSLTVDDDLTLTVGALNIEKSAVLKGVVAATNVTVKKGATLTNNGIINVDETGWFYNYGTVANNGTVDIPFGAEFRNYGKWNYNEADIEYTDPDAISDAQKAMNEVVEVWGKMWTTYMKEQSKYADYYAGNPYDYSKFVETVLVDDEKWNPEEEKLREYFEDENFLTTEKVVEPSEFKVAVDTYLKAQKDAAEAEIFDKTTGEYILTDDWNKYADFYNNEGEAKDAMSANMNQWANINEYFGGKAELAAYVWYAQNAVWSKFTVKFPYAYIWKTSTVDKAVDMWKQATDQGLATNKYSGDDSTGKGLVLWVSEVLGQSSTNNPAIKTYQDDLIELGIDIRNANEKLGGFNHDQIKACADKN